MTHPTLAALPEWRALEQDRAELARKREAVTGRVFAARREAEEAQQEWRDQLRRAVDAGEQPPPRPPKLDLLAEDHVIALLNADEDELRRREVEVLANVAPAVEEALLEAENARRAEVVDLARRLEDQRQKTREDLALLARVRGAQDARAGFNGAHTASSRTRTSVETDELLDAAVRGWSLLAPVARPTAPETAVVVDRPDPDMSVQLPPQRLGWQTRPDLGQRPVDPRELAAARRPGQI